MENTKKNHLIIYGKQPVLEALNSNHLVSRVILALELDEKLIRKISSIAERKKISIEYIPKAKMQQLCGPVVHQGVAAEISGYKFISKKSLMEIVNREERPLLLILDQIQDPHNLGAIIRTAEVCGVSAIILPEKGSAEINATVAKTSAGAIFHTQIFKTNNLYSILEELNDLNISIAAMIPGQFSTIYETDLTIPLAVIVGSEGKGVRKNLHKYCDLKISIPQIGKIDSLNVSVSTGIVLFEVLRQRRFSGKPVNKK